MTLRRVHDNVELEKLQDKIENFYFPLRHGDYQLTEYSKGTIVAAKIYRSQTWWRAKIIDESVQHDMLGEAVRVSFETFL